MSISNKIKKVMRIGFSYLLFIPFLMVAYACSDEMNELPRHSKVDGNLIVDQQSAIIALNGVYYQYAMCGTDQYDVKSTLCSSLYEIWPANFAGTATYWFPMPQLETHDVTRLTQRCSRPWNSFYNTVNAANIVIGQVGEAPDSYFSGNKKSEILGEAYGMRALAYYNLMKYFAYSWDINSPYGLILRTQQSTTTNIPTKRSTVKESYEQILNDVDFAIANAPAQNEPFYLNSWAAKILKARVLMMRGLGSDYQDAASLCADVINNSPYTLEEHYADIFHVKGLASSEVIFGIQPKENQSDVTITYFDLGEPQYFPSDNLLALYNNDPRIDEMYAPSVSMEFVVLPDGSMTMVSITKYAICKHLDPAIMATNDLEETQYQIRLSEAYLIRAEALARLGNISEAASLLKTVMAKAGITDFSAIDDATTQEAMLEQIFNEDMKNLSFECGLEHDIMLRFPESITLRFNSFYQEKQYNVFCIPGDEFKYNNQLTEADQNPGFPIDTGIPF